MEMIQRYHYTEDHKMETVYLHHTVINTRSLLHDQLVVTYHVLCPCTKTRSSQHPKAVT